MPKITLCADLRVYLWIINDKTGSYFKAGLHS